jgi:hypothetical protein
MKSGYHSFILQETKTPQEKIEKGSNRGKHKRKCWSPISMKEKWIFSSTSNCERNVIEGHNNSQSLVKAVWFSVTKKQNAL